MNSIETRTAILRVPKKNFLKVVMKEGVDVEAADAKENHLAALSLMGNERYVTLVDGQANCTVSPEAREYSTHPETYKNVIAMAIVVESLGMRLMGMFVMMLHKKNQNVNLELFKNVQEATEWLEKMYEEEKIFTVSK
ncbi:MAG: DUF7793 family protein [Bacteroidia bacterium]